MKSDPKKLLKKHPQLVESQMQKVTSHVQRQAGEWIINTILIEGYDVPFRFKRKQRYRNAEGTRVNLTYYPAIETIGGLEMEVMNVVRIKIA